MEWRIVFLPLKGIQTQNPNMRQMEEIRKVVLESYSRVNKEIWRKILEEEEEEE